MEKFSIGDVVTNARAIVLGIKIGTTTKYYDINKHIVFGYWDFAKKRPSSKKKKFVPTVDIEEVYLPFSLPILNLPTYPGFLYPGYDKGDTYVMNNSGRPCFVEIPDDFPLHGKYELVDAANYTHTTVQAPYIRRQKMEDILNQRIPGKVIEPESIRCSIKAFVSFRKRDPNGKRIVTQQHIVSHEWLETLAYLITSEGLTLLLPVKHLKKCSL